MSGPMEIGGRKDVTPNYLSISTSPVSNFHTPIGSYGHRSRANEGRLPSKQLQRFATEDIKILLLENINETAQKILRNQGYQVEFLKGSLAGDSLREKIR